VLDTFEADHPTVRIVRLRTSLVFQRSAASEIHRLFLGRLLPWRLPRPLRLVPRFDALQFQATHADDIADAYVRVIKAPVRGAFNVAAEPVLDPTTIARAVGGRTVPLPTLAVRFVSSVDCLAEPFGEELLAFVGAPAAGVLGSAEELGEVAVAALLGIRDVGLEPQGVAQRLLCEPNDVVVLVSGTSDLTAIALAHVGLHSRRNTAVHYPLQAIRIRGVLVDN
jgi:hypothetical protein